MPSHDFQLEVTSRLAKIEVELTGIHQQFKILNGTTKNNKKRIRILEDTALTIASRNKIKVWFYNNAAGLVGAVLAGYIIYKLTIN